MIQSIAFEHNNVPIFVEMDITRGEKDVGISDGEEVVAVYIPALDIEITNLLKAEQLNEIKKLALKYGQKEWDD